MALDTCVPTGNPDRRLEDQARVVHIKMNFMGVHGGGVVPLSIA